MLVVVVDELELPQPANAPKTAAKTRRPSNDLQARRRAGTPKKAMQARMAQPIPIHPCRGIPAALTRACLAEELAAVVPIVTVPVAVVSPLLTVMVEPVQLGVSVPLLIAATEQVSVMVPV